MSKRLKFILNGIFITPFLRWSWVEKMESTNQGIPLGGNPSPFSSWGDVGAPHMATLSLPGLTISLPVWLFSTSVVQNTAIPEQSNQKLDKSRVTHQPSTSSNSSSPPSSLLDGASEHRLTKIHTLHRPGLNRHVSFAKETTFKYISLASLRY